MDTLLLTTDEAAQLLRLNPSTLTHWACESKRPPPGFPKPVKLGRSVRWRRADLADFIDGIGADQPAPARPRLGRPRKPLAF